MAISTYSGLKSAVASWLARSDLTSAIQDFIALAESDFNATLFLNRLLTRDAAFAASAKFTSLPSDFRRMRSVSLVSNSTRYSLEYVDPTRFALEDTGSTSNSTLHYTIVGDEIGLNPTPSAVTLELVYWPTVTALSDSVTTSDLLTIYPLLYLYRSCVEGAIYMRDDSLQARAEANYARALAAAMQSDMSNAYGTAPRVRVA